MKKTFHRPQSLWVLRLSAACAVLGIFLGLSVLTGWIFHVPVLTQFTSACVPMHYNEAIGLCILGLGLLSTIYELRVMGTWCGISVCLYGGIALWQDFFRIGSYLGIKATPNSSLCFLLMGAALIMVSAKRWSMKRMMIVQVGIVGVLPVALIALIGYAGGIETEYGWGYFSRMALPASAGFFILGVGLLNYSLFREGRRVPGIPPTLPIISGLGFAMLAIFLGEAYSEWEKSKVEKIIVRETDAVKYHLISEVEKYTNGLVRIGNRKAAGVSRADWEADTRLYLLHEPAYQAIAWVDSSYEIKWRVSAKDPLIPKVNILDGGRRQAAFLSAAMSGQPRVSQSLTLASGGKGFLIIWPVGEGASQGFIVGVFRFDPIIDQILKGQIDSGFSIQLFEGDESVYFEAPRMNGDVEAEEQPTVVDVPLQGTTWRLEVLVPRSYFLANYSYMPQLIVIIGLLFAALSTIALSLARLVRIKNLRLEEQNFQQTLLSTLGEKLTGTLDYQQRLQQAADFLSAELVDICLIAMLEEGQLRFKAVGARDKAKSDQIKGLESHLKFQSPLLPSPQEILETRRPVLIQNVESELLLKPDLDPEIRKRLEKSGVTSFTILPLISRGHAMGTLALSMTNPERQLRREDLPFVQVIASRCAVAAENAKLYLELQEANKAREVVLSIVSHDLRNPVSTIDLAAQSLVSTGDISPTDLGAIAGKIRRSTLQMMRLISDLLDFGKIQEGNFTVRPCSVSPRMIAESALEGVLGKAKEKGVEILSEIPFDICNVHCDPDRIVQVLWNLLGNSVKFTSAGGQVRICARAERENVVFSVIDSGTGLEPCEVSKVFDRFWQSSKSAHLGTGLGLSIAKGIVEAHGGRIWAESKKGQGCCFHFTVPIAKREVAELSH